MKRAAVFLSLFLASAALGQEARNAAYLELGGNGIVYSVNYERRFAHGLAGRAGVSYVFSKSVTDNGSEYESAFTIPLTLSKITHPSGNHHFEYGGGVTLVVGDSHAFGFADSEELSDLYVTGIAGYRYQKPGRGVVFRSGVTPIAGGGEFVLAVGISIG
jgi:hypothetical protein